VPNAADQFVPGHILSFKLPRGRERCFFQDVAEKVRIVARVAGHARSRPTMPPQEHPSLPVTLKGAWFISSGGSLAMDVVVHRVGDDGENIGQVRLCARAQRV